MWCGERCCHFTLETPTAGERSRGQYVTRMAVGVVMHADADGGPVPVRVKLARSARNSAVGGGSKPGRTVLSVGLPLQDQSHGARFGFRNPRRADLGHHLAG